MRRHVIVIGAGIVGSASALALLERGHEVTLVDPDGENRGASWGNAGHIAVEQVAPLASVESVRSAPRRLFWRGGALALPLREVAAWGPFAARMLLASSPTRFKKGQEALSGLLSDAMPAWRRLVTRLGRPDLLKEEGHLVCWGSEKAARSGRAAWSRAPIGGARLVESDTSERARVAELVAEAPADLIRFSGTGQVSDLISLSDTLVGEIEARGGIRLRQKASIEYEDGEGRVIVGGERLQAGAVVVAAGVGSGALMSRVGHKVPIIAERGYHIRSRDHDWPADLPPIVFEDRSMIVTRYAEVVQAASFVEFAREATPADPAKWRRLERHVEELGLPIRGPFERWMGARPTLPDYPPAIGRSRRADNLIYAFGHQHLGLTLGPVTGEIVGTLIDREGDPERLAPFDLERFT